MELEQGDILSCTVDRIAGTTVFVKIDGEEKPGTIHLSEIAPGRIRNLREYVVPKKTIICKILKIANDHIELSLRRVKEKEKKELIEQNKLEKSYSAILKTILKEKTPEAVKEIKKQDRVYNFLEKAKEDSKELEKIIGKKDASKILDILKAQKQKTIILKKEIKFHSTQPDGLKLIKDILGKIKEAEITYLGSGKYSLKREDKDVKTADTKLKEIIEQIEKQTKEKEIELHYK